MSVRRARAFTLAEVMVAMAVCATLCAVLVPAVRSASGAARTARCTSNLRQLGVAAFAYAACAEGALPAAVIYRLDSGVMRTIAWDFEQTGGSVRPGPLWSYADAVPEVQQCPAFDGPSTFGADPWTGYNYNTSYLGHEGSLPFVDAQGQVHDGWSTVRAGLPTGAVARPSRTALFGDGGWRGGANKFMRAPMNRAEGDLALVAAGTQAFRHPNGCTCACHLDGHVGIIETAHRGSLTPESVSRAVTGFPDNGFLSDDDAAYGGDE